MGRWELKQRLEGGAKQGRLNGLLTMTSVGLDVELNAEFNDLWSAE